MNLHLIKLPIVTSTNNYAFDLLEKNLNTDEGTIIWANEQTKGKGLLKNEWESEPNKNLTFSLILHPTFLHPSSQFMLSKMISLSIINFLQSKIPSDLWKIKWPNDIYYADKKIAGILIENIIIGQDYNTAIIGIGININQEKFYHCPNPISLKQISSIEYNLEECLNIFFTYLIKYYNTLKTNENLINSNYLSNLLNYHIEKRYLYNEKEIRARVTNVDEYGFLVLQTNYNKEIKCDLKEINYLFE